MWLGPSTRHFAYLEGLELLSRFVLEEGVVYKVGVPEPLTQMQERRLEDEGVRLSGCDGFGNFGSSNEL